jgi:hypothetical protein
MTMKVYDFNHAFAFTTAAIDGTDVNTCRSQILCACRLHNHVTGETSRYVLAKDCIGEELYVDRMVHVPSSHVWVMYSEEEFRLEKRFANHEQDIVQMGKIGERTRTFSGRYVSYSDVRLDLPVAEGRRLESREEIAQEISKSTLLVGRTTLEDEGTGQQAVLDYPLNYVNFHPATRQIQVDVGPLLVPDFSSTALPRIARLRVAYILHGEPEHAEFAVLAPTQVAPDTSIHTLHHAALSFVPARNEFFALV